LPVRWTRLAIDFDGLGVEVDCAWPLERRTMAWMRATSSSLVEGLGHVVVGAEAEAADLVLDSGDAGEDQDRRLHLGDAQLAQHVIAVHVGQVQVEQDDVVIVELAQIEAFLAEVGRIDVETFGLEHQLDA
jgi:hypothetical protein